MCYDIATCSANGGSGVRFQHCDTGWCLVRPFKEMGEVSTTRMKCWTSGLSMAVLIGY